MGSENEVYHYLLRVLAQGRGAPHQIRDGRAFAPEPPVRSAPGTARTRRCERRRELYRPVRRDHSSPRTTTGATRSYSSGPSNQLGLVPIIVQTFMAPFPRSFRLSLARSHFCLEFLGPAPFLSRVLWPIRSNVSTFLGSVQGFLVWMFMVSCVRAVTGLRVEAYDGAGGLGKAGSGPMTTWSAA